MVRWEAGAELARDLRATNQLYESNYSWVWGDYLFGSGFFLAREWLWLPRLNSKSSSSEYVGQALEIIFKSCSPIQIGWSWQDGARETVTEEEERNLNSATQLGQCLSWTMGRQSSWSSSPKLPVFLLSFVLFCRAGVAFVPSVVGPATAQRQRPHTSSLATYSSLRDSIPFVRKFLLWVFVSELH